MENALHRIIMRFSLIFFGGIIFLPVLRAQDFSSIGKRKPFQLSGSVSAMGGLSLGYPASSRLFDYSFGVALQPCIYGFSIPFSFSYARSRFSYVQPFTSLSLNPRYKWFSAYLGRTQMNMHPYGLGSVSFDGVGVEVLPTGWPWRFSAMYGAILVPGNSAYASSFEIDSLQSGLFSGNFKIRFSPRRAGAVSLGYQDGGNRVMLHSLYVRDRFPSEDSQLPATVTPQVNLISALDVNLRLYEDFFIESKLAYSFHTSNVLASSFMEEGTGSLQDKGGTGFLPRNATTSHDYAVELGFRFKGLGLSYERVSPGYVSLGAAYLDRNHQNLVLRFSHTYRSLDMQASMGWQQDGISRHDATRAHRLVGAASVNYRYKEFLSVMASYSNFTSYTRLEPTNLMDQGRDWIYDPDTLSYRQISQQASLNMEGSFGDKVKHRIGLDVSYQSSRFKDDMGLGMFYYTSMHHSCEMAGGWGLASAVNLSGAAGSGGDYLNMGPSLTLNKNVLDNALRLSGGVDCYFDLLASETATAVTNVRLRTTYVLRRDHHFVLQLQSRLRTEISSSGARGKGQGDVSAERSTGSDFQIMVSYQYRFKVDPYKDSKRDRKENGND